MYACSLGMETSRSSIWATSLRTDEAEMCDGLAMQRRMIIPLEELEIETVPVCTNFLLVLVGGKIRKLIAMRRTGSCEEGGEDRTNCSPLTAPHKPFSPGGSDGSHFGSEDRPSRSPWGSLPPQRTSA